MHIELEGMKVKELEELKGIVSGEIALRDFQKSDGTNLQHIKWTNSIDTDKPLKLGENPFNEDSWKVRIQYLT